MKKYITQIVALTVLAFGSSCAHAQDGALDLDFAPNGMPYVNAIEKLADGRVMIAYVQSTTGGIKIFNSDGTDAISTFFPVPVQTGFSGNWISDIIQQQDGKILLVNSNNAPKIHRFNLDGTIDQVFQTNIGTGANLTVNKALLDADGKIVLIGDFTSFNGVTKSGIVRLNSDGTIDNTFITTTQNCDLRDICHNEYGGYFLAGMINGVNEQYTYSNTVKLKNDGSIDSTFSTYESDLERIALLPDNRLIGVSTSKVIRFNQDGQDSTIAYIGIGPSQAVPSDIHVQADGKIILTGKITTYSYAGIQPTVNNVFRIYSDGTFDPGFNPGAGPSQGILTSKHTSDEALLVAGEFWQFDGQSRNYVARLHNSVLPLGIDNNTTIIDEFSHHDHLVEIYPNPADHSIYVESIEPIESLDVFNELGQLVFKTKGDFSGYIDVSDFSSGVYVLNIKFESGSNSIRRIIKN
jgi:uncharacterized delta-60 repeat protein